MRRNSMACRCMRGIAQRVLAMLLVAILCVSMGMPAALTHAGLSSNGSSIAFAAEGDGGTDPVESEPTYVNVPYVMQKTIPEARSQLEAAGFVVVVLGDSTDTSTVVTQDIIGQAPQGSTITITGKETEVSTPVLDRMIVGYVDPDTGTYIQYPDAAQGQVPIVKIKGGRIQLLSTVFWDTGKGGYAADQGVPVSWSSGDTNIATVDPTGMLTASKDGEVTITCTSQRYGEVLARIDVKIVGQDGAYVTEVVITRDDGTPYRDERILFKEKLDGKQNAQPYATVYYSDGTQKCTWKGEVIDNLVWSSTDAEICYVNPDTGRILPKDDGSVRAVATVSGGISGNVSGYVYVVIDTGRYNSEYWPSDTLRVEISYAADESRVAKTKTYDVGSFSALGLTQAAYTVVTNNGHYATSCAEGVTLSRLLDDLGLVKSEVSHFRLFPNDNNGAQISADYLFNRPSYYFPNMDIGLTNGRVVAEPMIAVRDSWRVDSTERDFSQMNEGRRFRMVLGSSSLTDSAGSKTIKFIHTIKIVMQGSEPVLPPDGNDPDSPGGPGGNDPDGPGGLGEETGGGGGGLGSGPGSVNGFGTSEGEGFGDTSGSGVGVAGSSGNAEDESGASADGLSEGQDTQETSSRWQVFQMMSKAESDIDPLDFHNPIEPFLIPGVTAVAAAGGGFTLRRYRKELAV